MGDPFLNVMKTLILSAVLLTACSVSFFCGCSPVSDNVSTYSVNGYPVSFNRANPTYGLSLMNYRAILLSLQNGRGTNAIPGIEAMLDAAVYDAQCRRPLLHGKERNELDAVLIRVAKYRQEFPRPITNSTNQVDQFWIARQKEVDTFLRSFVATNAVNAQPQK
jgi:hypothetical protein